MIAAPAQAGIDARARAAVQRALPVRFGVAFARPDVEAVFRLRWEVAVAEGWLDPGACPDGLERDEHDEGAVLVAGWGDGRLVATARIVLPAPDRRLPTEAAFGLLPGAPPRSADVGRLCVAPEARGLDSRVFQGLLGQVWAELRARGCGEALSVVTDRIAGAYARWGLAVEPLGSARWYWGAVRWPARVAPPGR